MRCPCATCRTYTCPPLVSGEEGKVLRRNHHRSVIRQLEGRIIRGKQEGDTIVFEGSQKHRMKGKIPRRHRVCLRVVHHGYDATPQLVVCWGERRMK
jgi:hypothetical protein